MLLKEVGFCFETSEAHIHSQAFCLRLTLLAFPRWNQFFGLSSSHLKAHQLHAAQQKRTASKIPRAKLSSGLPLFSLNLSVKFKFPRCSTASLVKVGAAGRSLCGKEFYSVVFQELSLWRAESFCYSLLLSEGFWACSRENGVGGLLKFL